MNIGPYTFLEFKERAAHFHGYPAPGLLIGGYMVSMAQRALPKDTLFEAVVETKKCLPDAVQLLTVCSTGNNWMKVLHLGRYAVSLVDKYTGIGVRVHLDAGKLGPYPELKSWFLKHKVKADQDSDRLLQEIETAGESICTITPVRVRQSLLEKKHMGTIGLCPQCHEAYPQEDGYVCRGCQGEAPFLAFGGSALSTRPLVRVLPVNEAVGHTSLHDMTQVIPGEFKGVAFPSGHNISAGDVCRLQQMGRFSVAVVDEGNAPDAVHENAGAEAFAARMAGTGIHYALPPQEGKINFTAAYDGLLCVDSKQLEAFNLLPDVMCATRQDAMLVTSGSEVGGTRVIPLYIGQDAYASALGVLAKPLFSIAPLRKAKVGILVTGTEVFQGLVQDKFVPLITRKVAHYGCEVLEAHIVPDHTEQIEAAIASMQQAGVDLLITTGGLSVDPEDITRQALLQAGLENALYGMPVLPGTMSLVGQIGSAKDGRIRQEPGQALPIVQPQPGCMQVLGVPACALYFKVTVFDVLLPRLLAGREITRAELARFGEGGFCMQCKVCTWPKCFFVK